LGSSVVSTFTLAKVASPEALARLRADVLHAVVEQGETAVALDIDDIGILDSAIISALILLLREVRERGASISLRASRTSLLDTLRITALDKVFTVSAASERPVPPPSAARARRSGRHGRGRFVAALAAGAFALGSLLSNRASADTEPAPSDLVSAVAGANAAMQSYEAAVKVDFHLRSFPFVSEHLDGTTYFKRPDDFEVVFEKVPAYAKGFDRLYSDIDDPSSWERRFDLSYVGDKTFEGHRDVVLRLVQKVRGMIDHEDVAIDPAAQHIDGMEWHYYNGGVIQMTQHYQHVGGFEVLAKQHAVITIPFVHAAADAAYSDYKTNVAIDDSIFSREKH
jgi:anti-anti-sigma regulatory factor